MSIVPQQDAASLLILDPKPEFFLQPNAANLVTTGTEFAAFKRITVHFGSRRRQGVARAIWYFESN